jgi:hypothetical protein
MNMPHGRVKGRRPPVTRRGKSERRARIRSHNVVRKFDYALWCQRFGNVLTYRQWQHMHMRKRVLAAGEGAA